MVLPLNFWILFGLCMLVSSIGFKNYVWFISLGYGFSIAAEGIAMLILYGILFILIERRRKNHRYAVESVDALPTKTAFAIGKGCFVYRG